MNRWPSSARAADTVKTRGTVDISCSTLQTNRPSFPGILGFQQWKDNFWWKILFQKRTDRPKQVESLKSAAWKQRHYCNRKAQLCLLSRPREIPRLATGFWNLQNSQKCFNDKSLYSHQYAISIHVFHFKMSLAICISIKAHQSQNFQSLFPSSYPVINSRRVHPDRHARGGQGGQLAMGAKCSCDPCEEEDWPAPILVTQKKSFPWYTLVN